MRVLSEESTSALSGADNLLIEVHALNGSHDTDFTQVQLLSRVADEAVTLRADDTTNSGLKTKDINSTEDEGFEYRAITKFSDYYAK